LEHGKDMIRDRIFISYAHKDDAPYRLVRRQLLDQGLGDYLWDDTEIRASEQWDPCIREHMERTAVAVIILSNHYFHRRKGGGEYILETELPHFLEHYELGELSLLLLYWSPSAHFDLEHRGKAKPFEYRWEGQQRSFDLHQIQALSHGQRLANAGEQERLDTLLELAREAEQRLNERLTAPPPLEDTGARPERRTLTLELAVDSKGPTRAYWAGDRTLAVHPPRIPRAEVEHLRTRAGLNLPPADEQAGLAGSLYRLLFGPPEDGVFPRVASQAWGQTGAAEANSLSVELALRCHGMDRDPWPLHLPWHLTAFRGTRLAEIGWSFEVTPPTVSSRIAQALSPEPPLLLLIDPRVPGAGRHADRLTAHLDRSWAYATDCRVCRGLEELAEHVAKQPRPEVLYAYAGTDLDLAGLARILRGTVPLAVLNLVGELPPTPPPALVRGRKLICAAHGAGESDTARDAGRVWLDRFLRQAGREPYQHSAIEAFGPRIRLWSGCAELQVGIPRLHGALFRRPLIKLLLDRVTAREKVGDAVAANLQQGRGVLALVAAGTRQDHPRLLPRQVWYHYERLRPGASRDSVDRLELPAGPLPDAGELLFILAEHLGTDTGAWEDAFDRRVGELEPGEHRVLSLEWRVPPRPGDQAPEAWREDWLRAWLDLGSRTLVNYRRQGVLIVHMLLPELDDPGQAELWCSRARELYRQERPRMGERKGRFYHHHLAPLSEVPVDDIEHFLDFHYQLGEQHPELDPYKVAEWIHQQHSGVFSKTVDLVEHLHDTGFREAYEALLPGNAP
jgi:hypothetical protein